MPSVTIAKKLVLEELLVVELVVDELLIDELLLLELLLLVVLLLLVLVELVVVPWLFKFDRSFCQICLFHGPSMITLFVHVEMCFFNSGLILVPFIQFFTVVFLILAICSIMDHGSAPISDSVQSCHWADSPAPVQSVET